MLDHMLHRLLVNYLLKSTCYTYYTWYFLVRIFPHSDWIQRDTECFSVFSSNAGKYEPEKLWIQTLFTQWLLVLFTNVNPFWALHKKWSFPLRISVVNVTKSTGNCGFGHVYWGNPSWKNSFFVQWSQCYTEIWCFIYPYSLYRKLLVDLHCESTVWFLYELQE